MKDFVLQPLSQQAKSQSLVFIFCNIYQIANNVLEFDVGGPLSLIVNLLWGMSLSVIIIGNYELTKDRVPEFWRTGSAVLATVILMAAFLETANPPIDGEPQIDTTLIYFFFLLNLVFGHFITEGIYKNVYRYLTLAAAIFGVFATGADVFFDYELPETLQPLFILIFLGFTIGVGYGNYDAWKNYEGNS